MAYYGELDITDGDVSIGAPLLEKMATLSIAEDVSSEVSHWLQEAATDPAVLYFGIFHWQTWVGEIVLHDISVDTGESLIAFHLFEPHMRGKGIGTRALHLLVQFVKEEMPLRQLVIITSRENIPSQRIALKNGFHFAGPSREDPVDGMVFVLDITL